MLNFVLTNPGRAKAAFDLYEQNPSGSRRKITVFEQEAKVGGRIRSTYGSPEDDLPRKIEEGASPFFADDWCLLSAMDHVGLKTTEQFPRHRLLKHTVDDDQRTELNRNAESETWREFLRRRWRYGRSCSRLGSEVRQRALKFRFSQSSSNDCAFSIGSESPGKLEVVRRSLSLPLQQYHRRVRPCWNSQTRLRSLNRLISRT